MRNITSKIQYGDDTYELTWIKDSDISKYAPIKQVSGIVFDSKGHLLICKTPQDTEWSLPGGKPEFGESIEDTLHREVAEEVNVLITNPVLLGVQKVLKVTLDNSAKPCYQVRMVATVSEILDRIEDPANGEIWERKFVPIQEAGNYIDWGLLGETLFTDATALYLAQPD